MLLCLLFVSLTAVIAQSNNSCINARANVIGEGRVENCYYETGRQGIIGQDLVIASCNYGDTSLYPLYGIHAYYGTLFADLTVKGATAQKTISKGTIIDNSGHISV